MARDVLEEMTMSGCGKPDGIHKVIDNVKAVR